MLQRASRVKESELDGLESAARVAIGVYWCFLGRFPRKGFFLEFGVWPSAVQKKGMSQEVRIRQGRVVEGGFVEAAQASKYSLRGGPFFLHSSPYTTHLISFEYNTG